MEVGEPHPRGVRVVGVAAPFVRLQGLRGGVTSEKHVGTATLHGEGPAALLPLLLLLSPPFLVGLCVRVLLCVSVLAPSVSDIRSGGPPHDRPGTEESAQDISFWVPVLLRHSSVVSTKQPRTNPTARVSRRRTKNGTQLAPESPLLFHFHFCFIFDPFRPNHSRAGRN